MDKLKNNKSLLLMPLPYQVIELPQLRKKHIRLTIKRLDLIHPEIQGNKWFKLKYNIEKAVQQGHTRILTFGGAFSNHIHATALAARQAGLDAVGVIRGEETLPLNPTLADAEAAGMVLHYISRSAYREKHAYKMTIYLKETFGDFYLIPEGGTNELAISGTKEILEGGDFDFDFVCTSVGTGGTLAGLLAAAHPAQHVLGFSSLKGAFIDREIQHLLEQFSIRPVCAYELIKDYHFGGYGKVTAELINFIHHFYSDTGIPLDPIYTGKMMFGMMQMADGNKIPAGSRILALHTGGLQGIRGFNMRHGANLADH